MQQQYNRTNGAHVLHEAFHHATDGGIAGADIDPSGLADVSDDCRACVQKPRGKGGHGGRG